MNPLSATTPVSLGFGDRLFPAARRGWEASSGGGEGVPRTP